MYGAAGFMTQPLPSLRLGGKRPGLALEPISTVADKPERPDDP